MDWLYVFNVSAHVIAYGVAAFECNRFLVSTDDPNDESDWIVQYPKPMRMGMYAKISLVWPLVLLTVLAALTVVIIIKWSRK